MLALVMSGWRSDLEFRFQTAVCAWSPLGGKERDEQDHRAPTENVPLSRKGSVTLICQRRGGACAGQNHALGKTNWTFALELDESWECRSVVANTPVSPTAWVS